MAAPQELRRTYTHPEQPIPDERRQPQVNTDNIPTEEPKDEHGFVASNEFSQFGEKSPPRAATWGGPELPRARTWAGPEHLVEQQPMTEGEKAESLRIYRELVGITSPDDLLTTKERVNMCSYLFFNRVQKNRGYYQVIIDEELKATVWYQASTWLTNFLLATQIAIAATLTALGVARGKERGVAISVLGAVNTAVATLLAYFKAKGLPMRALTYRNDLRRLREHVEYTERQFRLGVTALDPAKAAASVRDTFDRVVKTQQKQETDAELGVLSASPAGLISGPADLKLASSEKPKSTAGGTAVPTSTTDAPPGAGVVSPTAAEKFAASQAPT